MNNYNVRKYYHSFIDVVVLADNEKEAIEKARMEIEDMSDEDFFYALDENGVTEDSEDECSIIYEGFK